MRRHKDGQFIHRDWKGCNSEELRPIYKYSLIFFCTAILVYSGFWLAGKSFVWKTDGLPQHLLAMAYIGKWGREILRNVLVNHSLVIPVWDFSIGQGADIVTTLQYYGLGDPLVLLSVFVPMKYVEILYNALIIIRVYLAGLFFVCFCLHMKQKEHGVVAGALAYAFCGYSIFAGVRHPFFLTPMVYFPLLLLGSEKILKRENPWIFIISLFLSVISNFYFAYMQCIAAIIYVMIRYFSVPEIRHIKELPKFVIRFVFSGVVGLMMAAIFLLPVANSFRSSIRTEANNAVPLLYYPGFYAKYFINLLGSQPFGYWSTPSFVPTSLISMILLFRRRNKHTWLKVLIGTLLVMQLLPFVGHIMNGFSYVSNRWSWSFVFVVSYIVAIMWQDLMTLDAREKRFLVAVCSGYLLLCLLIPLEKGVGLWIQWGLLILGVLLVCVDLQAEYRNAVRQWGTVALCIVSVTASAWDLYVEREYIKQFIDLGQSCEMITQTTSFYMQDYMDDEEFSRYTLNEGYHNESALSRTHGTSIYWSLIGNHLAQYRNEMEIVDTSGYTWRDFDRRHFLDALNNVRYRVYLGRSKSMTPEYGYDQCLDYWPFSIYENSNCLPIGYTYDTVLTQAEYELLTTEQRQEVLLQNILLEQEPRNAYPMDRYETTSWEVDYTVLTDMQTDDYVIMGKEVFVKNEGAKIVILFEPQADCELYLNLKGFYGKPLTDVDFEKASDNMKAVFASLPSQKREDIHLVSRREEAKSELYLSVADGQSSNRFLYRTQGNQFYFGKHDYLVNLGYMEEARSTLTITFEDPGVYSFENMRVVCQAMDKLGEYVSARSEESVRMIEMGTNSMSAGITVIDNKILCLAVPYSAGWTAYVDGEETPVLRANVWSMAIELEPGEHEILFKYETPWMKPGMYLTIAGVLLFALIEYGFLKKKWYVQ